MRSLKQKLLLIILPLCLIPLIGISFFSYYQAKGRITQDRIVLYLEQIAQGLADTVSLTLLERQEEVLTTGLVFSDFLQSRQGAAGTRQVKSEESQQQLLDSLLLIHEVYDVIVVFDVDGRILLVNSVDRNFPSMEQPVRLDPEVLKSIRGRSLTDYTPTSDWLQQVRSGRFGYVDWHVSPIVKRLYRYGDRDVAFQYSIGFAAPISDSRGVVVGGVLALMNWFYIQEILDNLESELEFRSLRSGYAFLFARDGDTIIAHKYRRNRDTSPPPEGEQAQTLPDNYGTSLTRDHHLDGLAGAVREMLSEPPPMRLASHFDYEYPLGTAKISGLAAVHHDFFEWVCGVGINDEDIFAPVQELKNVLVLAALFSSLLIVALTFSVARQITTPLKKLTLGASVIAGGDLSQRVEVSGRDEIGELAATFNEMAESLQERSQALIDLNRQLEQKVEERTRELQKSHAETHEAYLELKETQVQLVQSEKMASLGQLVAGIAHEIKNPLNFIYGNTDFLKQYVGSLKRLIRFYEEGPREPGVLKKAERLKSDLNYEFVSGDLDTLIENFEEGAKRIHAIIGDLRSFSRMDSDELRPVDIHQPMEQALNLLRHEYRDRIKIHRDYGDLPKVQCHSGKLSQVFMNLLANACQAIPEAGEIHIRTRREGDRVVIEIEDNGAGIDEAHLNKVFEPFFTTKPVGKGTGLGLSISYGIIRQHRGEISVRSRKNQGTCFRIELPVGP